MTPLILSTMALLAATAGANLMPNSEFKDGLAGWGVDGSIVRRVEPIALSGVYVMRAAGGGTHHIGSCTSVTDWKDDEDYTMVVNMRSIGAGSAIWITQGSSRNPKKKSPDVPTYLAMNVGVDREWHEYFFPFHTPKGLTPWGFQFRKVDAGGDDTGIEFKSIKLYRGRLSSFDIRKIMRPGRQTPTAGTEIPLRPSRYGRAARPMRVFAVVGHYNEMREALHLFAATGDRLDLVVALSRGGDVYQSDGDGAEIRRRLKAGDYDAFLIARNIADRIGPELAALVIGGVKRGAGLYYAYSAKDGAFEKALKEVRDGRLGKGRVLRFGKTDPRTDAPGGKPFECPPRARIPREGLEDFPFTEIDHATVTETVRELAFGEPGTAAREKREETLYAGERHLETWGLDRDGKTVFYRYGKTPLETARLGAFADGGAVASVAVLGGAAGTELRWSFGDFAGRVFGEGRVKVEGEGGGGTNTVSLTLPREKLFTNFGLVKLELVDAEGNRLDRRNESIFVKENDRRRLLDDYTMSMWPISGQTSHADMADYCRQLTKVGFKASFMPAGGLGVWSMPFRAGLAPSAGYLVGGSFFSGNPPAKDNVRTQNFNCRAGRKRIGDIVRTSATGALRYGVIHAPLSDEAQLGPADQEVDEHPENVAEYRRRMQAKYGTIAAYNAAHQTAHASFGEVGPVRVRDARKTENVAEFVEWRRYNIDRWIEIIRFVGDEARKIQPDLLYSYDNSFGESAFNGNDYWKLLSRTGFDFSKEYTSMVHFSRSPLEAFDEVYRSFCPDMRVWGWVGYGMTSEHNRFMPWWFAAHRYGGFTWFAATYWSINLLDVPSGALTLDAKECGEAYRASRLGDGLGKILTTWKWAKRDIAIYYSHDSMMVATFRGKETKNQEMIKGGPMWQMLTSRLQAQYLVEDLLYQHDYVSYEQVAGGKLLKDGYRVLLMPKVLSMTDAEVAAVRAFVAAGGTVIADSLPGECNELGVMRAANPFEELKAKGDGAMGKGRFLVTNEPFNDLDRKQRAEMLARLEKAGATRALESETAVANFGREAMHYVRGDIDLYVILRKSGRSTDAAEDRFAFAREGFVYDVRARKCLGRMRSLAAKVPLHEASVYAVLPAPVTSVEIAGLPKSFGPFGGLRRGNDLTVDLSADIENTVLHAELVPPSLTPEEDAAREILYTRNLDAPGGKARLVFPIAFSDPAGEWMLRVTEPLTGRTVERMFKVR